MKNVITAIALTIASTAAMATEVSNPGNLDQVSQVQGTGDNGLVNVGFLGVNCSNIHALEAVSIFPDGTIGDVDQTVAVECMNLENTKAQAVQAIGVLQGALTEIAYQTTTINGTEAASRASYLPLFHSYNGLLAERDDVLQQLVAETAAVTSSRGAWENEQAAVRQDIANARQDQMERIADARAVREMRPVIARSECTNPWSTRLTSPQRGGPEYLTAADCFAHWDSFYSARGDYYAEYGSQFNLMGHIADAEQILTLTDDNAEVEAIVQANPLVQEALSRYQDAVTTQASSTAMTRLTAIDSIELPAALAALMAHPYFN